MNHSGVLLITGLMLSVSEQQFLVNHSFGRSHKMIAGSVSEQQFLVNHSVNSGRVSGPYSVSEQQFLVNHSAIKAAPPSAIVYPSSSSW